VYEIFQNKHIHGRKTPMGSEEKGLIFPQDNEGGRELAHSRKDQQSQGRAGGREELVNIERVPRSLKSVR